MLKVYFKERNQKKEVTLPKRQRVMHTFAQILSSVDETVERI